jgi:steroid 5-alpha reductase family enzyme
MLNDILYTLAFIVGLQVLFATYAIVKKTDKVTDLSYGLTFVLASIFSLLLNRDSITLYKVILLALVSIWGLRLAIYLFIRILKTGKDKRFDDIRNDFRKFAGFWILQAVSISIILLPSIYIFSFEYDTSLSGISYVGLVLAALGILIEAVADQQKYIFKKKESNKNKWISTGLWKYSRHPNYLGEIMMWLGVFIYSSVYISGIYILTFVSPLFITLLLLFVSGIPTLEDKYDERYAGDKEYIKYKEKTGILLPKIF